MMVRRKHSTIIQGVNLTRLPTSHQKNGKLDSFMDIPVLSRSTRLRDIVDSASYSEKLLSQAWAILLRAYILTDRIMFEVSIQHDTIPNSRQLQNQIADCQWGCKLDSSLGDMNTLVPSIEIFQKPESLLLENLTNTILVCRNQAMNLQQHHDFMLMYDCEKSSNSLILRVRESTVSVKFGHAVADTLTGVLLALIRRNPAMLSEAMLSSADKMRLKDLTRRPLFDEQSCLHDLVQKTAEINGTSEAICAWDGHFSYDKVQACSDIVARRLVAIGVKLGDYIPFAFEKSAWSVIASLAILKSGGAFVPLDPIQPLSYLSKIITDIGARVVLASTTLEPLFQGLVENIIIVSDGTVNPDSLDDNLTGAVLPKVRPEDTAFVLFTSGSTGTPKGMIMQHGAYSTHTICHGKAMKYEKARVLQFAAHTFDVYVMDVFATLTFGGCICIPSEEDRKFNIIKIFHDFKIDLAILTPSFAHLLDPALLTSLKTLAIGGEALKKETLQKWCHDAKGVDLMGIYGPAELGICILGHLNTVTGSPEWLGYPMENSLCLLIDPDDDNKLVPMGAVGELVVTGPTMLKEYLNMPGKTRSSFLSEPRWAKDLNLPYRRFYKSGDLLRYNIDSLDGSFDFIGRRDSQVKYHGQRMELEGIEHHLSSMKSVSACMVSLPKDGILNGKLVAVLQEKSSNQVQVRSNEPISIVLSSDLTLGQVRAHLSTFLPANMIPNALLVVQNLPFTPSLKLSRPLVNHWIAHLHDDTVTEDLMNKSYCEPLSTTEIIARTISAEYARLVGRQNQRYCALFEGQNFCLQAGGIDSIQIISLSNFVQKTWDVKIPTSIILSSWATVRDLASIIDQDGEQKRCKVKIQTHTVIKEAKLLTNQLVSGVRQPRPKVVAPNSNVFLTGATGFLGIEILHCLLLRGCSVFALVRALNSEVARQRLISEAKAAGWWEERFDSKLEVWLGDLSRPCLGLDEQHQRCLGGGCSAIDRIDAVIHNGAKVHYGLDYGSLKNANVSATFELLKMVQAATVPRYSFVYISGGQQLTFTDERDICDFADIPPEHGYVRSKLVSEILVRECMKQPDFQNTRLQIVKPGYIIGNSDDGRPNMTDFLWRLVASCVEIGAFNADDADRWVFIADRRRVARAIADCTMHEEFSQITKILDGIRFSDLWLMLINEYHFILSSLPRIEWTDRIRKVVGIKQEAHPMFPLMHLLEEGQSIGSLGGPSEPSAGVRDALRANIKYLIEVGYLMSEVTHLERVISPTTDEK